jgi:hypothetical protein
MLVQIIEDECDGTLLCIEQEKPYQFSGLGFIDDEKEAYERLYKFCQTTITKLLDNNKTYKRDNLSDDEQEALEYFQCQ